MRCPKYSGPYTTHRFAPFNVHLQKMTGLGKWMHGGKVVWLVSQQAIGNLHFAFEIVEIIRQRGSFVVCPYRSKLTPLGRL